MSEKEIRAFKGAQIRATTNSNGVLSLDGYAATFGSLSHDLNGFRERIAPTAFTRALKEGADVRCLQNHDANFVLGRTRSGTLQLSTDAVGLRFTVQLPPTQYARDLHTSISRGDVNQCSFAFKKHGPDGDSWSEEFDEDSNQTIPIRTLRDVDLFDVSAVTYPAYEDTSVAARGLTDWRSNRPGNNQQRVTAKLDWRALDEQVLVLRHAINQKHLWQDHDRVHEQRMAEINEENRNATLKEIERLQKLIKHGRFSTLESYVEVNKNLQTLLAAVGKDAPSPQLS